MLAIETVVSKNSLISSDLYHLVFEAPRIAARAQPGQFIHLNITNTPSILRRPFSIFNTRVSTLEIVYKVVGKVTKHMSALQSNDFLSLTGPIGNGFNVKKNSMPVFIAGGTGLASLHFLKEKIKPGILFLGAKNKNHIWGIDSFENKGWKVVVTTEDGSSGTHGLITKPFLAFIKKQKDKIYVYTCGPTAMVREVSSICSGHTIAGQASLENMMACGVGACQGCVVELKGKKGYKRVCVDGPVFDIADI